MRDTDSPETQDQRSRHCKCSYWKHSLMCTGLMSQSYQRGKEKEQAKYKPRGQARVGAWRLGMTNHSYTILMAPVFFEVLRSVADSLFVSFSKSLSFLSPWLLSNVMVSPASSIIH